MVQWATGTIGARALRAVIEHPNLTLAGVYVNAADKVGVTPASCAEAVQRV